MPLPFARSASQTRPTFSRDFAGLKTLDHGVGPAITFTRGSDATYFNAAGVLTTATTNEPRFDHNPSTGNASLGLLIEEARTNSIPNSQMSGAASGTHGTPPTNWNISTHVSQGLNRTITTGTSAGLSYIDVAYSGTTNASFNIFLDPQSTNAGYVASSGQSWTGSVYVALISGSIPSGASFDFCVRGRDSGGISTSDQTLINPTLSSSLTRVSATRTFSSASTARVTLDISVTNVPTTTAVDFTLRIAAPQLEQGAFATSYIPTTNAAATRAADSAVVTPISSFYNQSEGTLFAEGSARNISANLPALVSIDDTTANERIQLRRNMSVSQLNFVISDGGTLQANIVTGTWTSDTAAQKAIAAYRADDVAVSFNGATVVTDSSATLPTVTQMTLGIGQNSHNLNGHIRRIAYWPRRLSNALLQQLTT